MPGYMNRVLRVDLTNQSFTEEPLARDLIDSYIGGAGFGVKFLYDDLKLQDPALGWDPNL